MQIHELTTIDSLGAIRGDWQRLLAETPSANFFHTLEWLEVYWRHFAGDQQLRVLVLEEDGQTSGIVPLVIRNERTRLGTFRFLTYPLDYWGSFYSPLGRDPLRVLAAATDYLSRHQRGWDIFEPRAIGGLPNEEARTREQLTRTGWPPVPGVLDQTAVIELDGTWEEYLANRTSKWRNNLGRWKRRLESLGCVEHLRYRPEAGADTNPRWDLLEQCLDIARLSWQGESKTGTTLSHSSIVPYIRDLHGTAAKAGGLDVNLLMLDGSAIAFAYNYHYRGNVFGLRVGYDPSIKASGIGNLLYARAIEDSFRRGDWRYDLGPGSLEIKRHLWTDVVPIYRLSCFRSRSPRQQLLKLKRQRDARRKSLEDADSSGEKTSPLAPVAQTAAAAASVSIGV